ncbi:unnamed protein product [Rhizoctonia solani]|uniref:Protein kinase domain-containing protein n=1 Tax=Rhizoctonia solani TaxID=456999 RepID=A0A8H2W879_9AGAM|nr:unnamed protein product [Rhizoctonia solani]
MQYTSIVQSLGLSDLTMHVSTSGSGMNVARGGVADVRYGSYKNGSITQKVAVKSVRLEVHGAASTLLVAKIQKRLYRELDIWKTLQAEQCHPNILGLLGIVETSLEGAPRSLIFPSSVSELCKGNLSEYMTTTEARSRRIQLLVDTLEGLSHMHKLGVVHGDLKAPNVLVTEEGTAKLCDFGHSRFVNTAPSHTDPADSSSTFQATTRYMSPELFTESVARPSCPSDIWAFGCVALEASDLSKLRPYHVIFSEYRVPAAIIQGRTPSTRPEPPYAAGCLNDSLWAVVKACWSIDRRNRPTALLLLERIKEMIRQGMISAASVTPHRPATSITSGTVEWPDKLEDYSGSLAHYSKELISNKNIADVWIYRIQGDSAPAFLQADERRGFDPTKTDDRLRRFVVKVPRLPGGLSTTSPEDDQFQQLLRLVVKERFDLDHENIVELIGLDRSYGRYPGIVLEYCPYGDLTHYKGLIVPYEKDNQRYLREISQGLEYLHSLPSVLTHGDLTPDNILVDGQGTLKLSIISFARVATSLPENSQVAVRPESPISVRYASPDLLIDNTRTSPESDMWSFGCVAFWIYTDLHPYPKLKKEYDIVREIESGVLPNDMNSIRNIETLGSHLKTGADSPWITDGTLSHILRCWDHQAKARPSANDILKHLDRLPNTSVVRWRLPTSVPDLSGAVQTPGGRNIIGWSAGTWRRIYTRRAQGKTPDVIKLWWWRGVHSRGFFRKNVDVIVKSAKSDKGEFEDPAQQVYRHELVLLNQMKHTNVVSILGFTTDPTHLGSHLKVPALIMEYCSNGRLREYCPANQETMNEADRVNLIRGIAQALKYIHDDIPEGSIVHGNLSMDSVVVDTTGIPKLTNFEFSCQYQHTDNPIRAQVLNAPPLASHPTRWDAPELFQDVSDARAPFPTRYTDLWSFGSLIAFIFCCKLPYAQSELPGAIARLINGERPYANDDCPHKIKDLANSLWEDVPYQRSSASKILEMIEVL